MQKKGINRREFLRLTTLGGVSALFIPDAVASTIGQDVMEQSPKIPVRPLGKTGIEVPILSMGVMRADNPNVLRAAFNSGIYHFDTAHGYQNGRNEELIGNFFAGKPRDQYCIATKVKINYPLAEDFESDFRQKVDLSLSRLKMDYVDIFYAHAYSKVDEVKDRRIIDELKRLKSERKARFLGFSAHTNMPELIHAAIDTGIYDVLLVSYNFKLNDMKAMNDALERAAQAGIGIVVMKSMAGGTTDADGKKKINAQACLKWVWQNPHISTIIPGFTNFEQLDECLAAAQNPKIANSEQEYLAALRDEEMLYCQQCGTCRGQCPKNLPIPDIMRAYMYTYGYKFAGLSKETLAELNLEPNACSDCGSCRVECPSGFNVARKIAAVTPVLQVPDEFLT